MMRHLWAHPESGQPYKLQLVAGSTLEKRLGSSALEALLDKVLLQHFESTKASSFPLTKFPFFYVCKRCNDNLLLVIRISAARKMCAYLAILHLAMSESCHCILVPPFLFFSPAEQ